MKALYILPLLLVGCSSGPQYKKQDMIIDRHVNVMSRNEIISAVHECEGNGLRASMIYAKRNINGFTADVVVDVLCAPKFKFY